MRLRKKMILLIGGSLFLMIIISFAGSHILLLNYISEIEKTELNHDMDRTVSILQMDLDNLDTTVHDWSSWDDTYTFVQDANDQYIQKNLMAETLHSLKINLMLFLDSNGKIVYEKAVDLQKGSEVMFPAELSKYLTTDSPLVFTDANKDTLKGTKGVMFLQETPVLIASRPVLTSLETGPVKGTLIFGRFLDEAKINDFSNILKWPIFIYRSNNPDIPANITGTLSAPVQSDTVAAQPINDREIAGYTVLNDIFNRPQIVLSIEIPRDAFTQGQITIYSIFISAIVIGIIAIIVATYGMDKFIISRIIGLSKNVINIGQKGDLSSRISESGKDELSYLTHEINRMLMTLEDSQQSLAKSQELYSILVEKSNDGIVFIDKGILKFANSKMEEISGYSIDELTNQPYVKLVSPEYKEFVIDDYSQRISHNHLPDKYETSLLSKDGKKIHVEVSLNTIELDKKRMIIAIIRDVTQRKMIQEKLITTGHLASIGELAAGIAHEINNPLTSVIGYTQLLLNQKIPDNIRKDLEIIDSQANRASEVIKNLLIFARSHISEKQKINVNELIDKVFILRSYEQKLNNIIMVTNLDPEIRPVIADPSELLQVFINIVVNAEYSIQEVQREGIIEVKTENKNGLVVITIADNGRGIPSQNLHRIFDPFFTTKDLGKGTGLGLSVCQGIIRRHNGKLFATSELDNGATFTIELPAAE